MAKLFDPICACDMPADGTGAIGRALNEAAPRAAFRHRCRLTLERTP